MVYLFSFALVGLAAVAAVGTVVRTPSSPVLADQVVTPILVSPSTATTSLAGPSQIVLVWSEPATLLWPNVSGTVTDVSIMPGDLIESGDVVAAVDRAGVLALATAAPLHRNLVRGDRGEDVLALTRSLEDLGMLTADDVGDRFTFRVSEAVRTLNEKRGVDSNVLSVGHVVWSPRPFRVGEVQLRVGALAPPPGSEPFVEEVFLAEARVVTADSELGGAGQPVRFEDGLGREVVLDAVPFAINRTGEVLDLASLAPLVAGSDELVFGSVTRLVEPLVTISVPISALLTSSDGGFCVINADEEVVGVEVLESRAGFALISAIATERVVANPGPAGVAVSCDI